MLGGWEAWDEEEVTSHLSPCLPRGVWVVDETIWMDITVLLVTCILLINNEEKESVRIKQSFGEGPECGRAQLEKHCQMYGI